MINVQLAVASLASAPGDHFVYTKAQAAQMLADIEVGQRARRALTTSRR